jgi:hypothetical protein
MADEVMQIQQVALGLYPYVLIQVVEVDENDDPLLDIKWGGGIDQEVLVEFLGLTAESLGYEPLTDPTEEDNVPD